MVISLITFSESHRSQPGARVHFRAVLGVHVAAADWHLEGK